MKMKVKIKTNLGLDFSIVEVDLDKRPIPKNVTVNAEDVVWVEADAKLAESIGMFVTGGLPYRKPGSVRSTRWYGDHAKFIVGNVFGLPEDVKGEA
jgi:hypothetical protein